MMMKKIYENLKLLLLAFAFLSAISLHAQTVVTGKVADSENSESLPGVSITVKGAKISTSTDLNGNFKIQVPNENSVLVLSFIGYKSQEVNVGNKTLINVRLVSDNIAMSEVVVVGYGTTKKVNLTGAVDVIKADRIENRPIANVGEGLQGLAPNLNVKVTSGDASSSPQFNIRGFESINGGSPLILVDNVPMDLNAINPEDIKSVTILKDGAASAIYGARAAFGVILVETKTGVLGTNVRVSSQLTLDRPIFHVDPIENGYEYALERNRIAARDLINPSYDAAYMEGLRKYYQVPGSPAYEVVNGIFQNYETTNLSKNLLSTFAPRQKYDLSVSGATDKASYYTSFGFLNSDGYLNYTGNDNFKRYNILAKGDYKIKKWLSFDQQITVNMQRSDKPSSLDMKRIIRNEPFRPHVVPLIPGYEKYEGKYWEHGLTILPELENGGRETYNNSDLWLKSGLTATPLNGLKWRSDFSYNSYNREYQNAQPSYDVIKYQLTADNPVSKEGQDLISVERNYNQYYVFNSYLEYVVPKLKDHYLKGLIGYNQEWDSNSAIGGTSKTFVTPSVIDVSATTGTQTLTGGKGVATLKGIFYRLNYNYKERYLVEANGRYDGTSRFPKNDRFGFFPSFSAGWRISEENFMAKSRNVIDNLKIRASYGSLGNQLLGDNNFYPYISTLPANFSNFVLNSGLIPYVGMPGLVSPTLTWEKVVSKNLGVDLAMFKGRLESFFEIYTRDTKNMLMRKKYPDILGISAPQENAADLRTKGWEFSAKWNDKVSKDLSYHVDFNLSDWTSKITRFDNPTGSLATYYEGQELGEIWGYETKGIIQTPADLAKIPDQSRLGNGWKVGDLEFVDQNGDNKINPGDNTLANHGDLIKTGNSNPRYSFGINTGANYKGFSVDLFFQGVGKRDYNPSAKLYTWFFPWTSLNGDKSWLTDSWTEDNRDAYFPAATYDGKNFVSQTRYLQNAAYIRLKSVTLSYNLPKVLVSKAGLGNIKVYLGAQNLFEASKIRKPLDPEYVYSDSIDYPLFKSYTFGLVVNL